MANRRASDPPAMFPRLEVNQGFLALVALVLWLLSLLPPLNLQQNTDPRHTKRAQVASVITDVKINGSDRPVTLGWGEPYAFSWASTNAEICDVVSPFPSAVTLNGASDVNPGEAFYYPTSSSPVILTFACANAGMISTDSVLVQFDVAPRRLMLATFLRLPEWRF